jgi:hypothetical protein
MSVAARRDSGGARGRGLRETVRAGASAILLTSRLADESAFNERHNELMFVEYLP